MRDEMPVGLIGAGRMGGRVAGVLASSGRELVVYDVNRAAVDRVVGPKVRAAPGVAELANQAEVAVLSLPRPEDVSEVVSPASGLVGSASSVRLAIDLSTIDPSTARRVAGVAASNGVDYVDSPVLGRPEGCGQWTLPMGGTEEATEQAALVLAPVAARTVRVGDVGTASVLKLLNNVMFGAINAATAEVMAACRAAGLDPAVFFDVLAESGAASVSNLFLELGPKIIARDFSPRFTVDLLHKDNALALSMLEDLGLPAFLASAVHLVNRMGVSSGLGDKDTSALFSLYEEYLDSAPT